MNTKKTVKKNLKEKPKKKVGAPTGKRQTIKRKEALLDVAARLFIKKGIDATTMDEIAAKAQVAKGTLYHYFSSKADLLEELRQVFMDMFTLRIRNRVNNCDENDWKARLNAWVDEGINAYIDMCELHDVVFHHKFASHKYAMSDMQFNQDLAKLIDNGTKAGFWHAQDPVWTATMMFYALHGGCDEARFDNRDTKELSQKITDHFLRILGVYE